MSTLGFCRLLKDRSLKNSEPIRLLKSPRSLSVYILNVEKDLLKGDKILGLTFFQASKDFEGFKTSFFYLLLLSFVVDGLYTTPVYSPRRDRFVNSAFPNKKNLAQKRNFYVWQTNLKANVCRNSTFQVNTRKNATWRRHLTTSYFQQRSRHFFIFSALHAKNDAKNLFDSKLRESTENNKAILFFACKETIKTFNGSI